MSSSTSSLSVRNCLIIGILCAAVAPAAVAVKETVLHRFAGKPDGGWIYSGLIFDSFGNLYGTTNGGGAYGWGSVFELSPNKDGTWTDKILYSFMGGEDGWEIESKLVLDNSGNLYGTTFWGGNASCDNGNGCGLVFELTPNPDGTWSKTTIHEFNGADGAGPGAGLIFDSAGNLYGTAADYGFYGKGEVFELTPLEGGTWQETVLYSFSGGKDGAGPEAHLLFDVLGNLYGTTTIGGGPCDCGTVFRLVPKSGEWNFALLHSFTGGKDGGRPAAYTGLALDNLGRLFGATVAGGLNECGTGCGVVYMLAPTEKGPWKETVLHRFQEDKESHPNGDLVFDPVGNLYGTTQNNSFYDYGSVFRLSPRPDGGVGYTVVFHFNGTNGLQPFAGPIFDSAGNLYGTTFGGGSQQGGLVYELSP
jgi:uncharacterized repeat protein (TIGR03803 family)